MMMMMMMMVVVVVVVVVMTRMMLTTRVGRWEEAKGGKEASRVSPFPPPIVPSALSFFFRPPPLPQPPDDTKGSFSNDEGDDSENVTFKMNKRFSNFVVSIPIR